MYENISSLRPYFYSLREIDTTVSLDLKLPINWEYDGIISLYKTLQSIPQDKNDKVTLLSLISISDEEGYNIVFACAKEIIKVNKEKEEKEILFQKKIKELKEIFQNQPLDKLKDLQINNLVNGQENTARIGISSEGTGERQDRIGLPKETDDKRVKKNRQAKFNIESTNSNENTEIITLA